MKTYKPLTPAGRQQYIVNALERTKIEYVVYGLTGNIEWEVATYFTEELAIQHAKDAQLRANALIAEYGSSVPSYRNEFDKHMYVVDNVIEYVVVSREV
jgi:hypothetical protein